MKASRNTLIYLTEEEVAFVLSMADQSASDSSSGISKEAVLRTLIRLLKHLEVDMSGIKTEDQLLQRLENAVERSRLTIAASE